MLLQTEDIYQPGHEGFSNIFCPAVKFMGISAESRFQLWHPLDFGYTVQS